jgi:hypothetical protein
MICAKNEKGSQNYSNRLLLFSIYSDYNQFLFKTNYPTAQIIDHMLSFIGQ